MNDEYPLHALQVWGLLLNTAEFIDFVNICAEKYNLNELSQVEKKKLRTEIKDFLHEYKFPFHWAEHVQNYIINKPTELTSPLHPSINISVLGQSLTGNDKILLIKDDKGMYIEDPIRISLHAKITFAELIKFLENHREDIEHWLNELDLPPTPRFIGKKRLSEALKIIKLKDQHGLTFSEISDYFSDDESLSITELEYFSSETNIKALYFRYKKYLSS